MTQVHMRTVHCVEQSNMPVLLFLVCGIQVITTVPFNGECSLYQVHIDSACYISPLLLFYPQFFSQTPNHIICSINSYLFPASPQHPVS